MAVEGAAAAEKNRRGRCGLAWSVGSVQVGGVSGQRGQADAFHWGWEGVGRGKAVMRGVDWAALRWTGSQPRPHLAQGPLPTLQPFSRGGVWGWRFEMMGRELHLSALHTSRDPELMPSSHRQTPPAPPHLAKMGEQACCAGRRPAESALCPAGVPTHR